MRDQNERSCKIIKFIAASLKAFTRSDWTICLGSIAVLAITFLLSERNNGMIFITSVAGIWCLIFIAKGNVLGQVLAVIFALFYGYVSWQYHYYGEMITYLGMSAPTAAIAAVSWWRHPYSDTEVKVEVVKLPAWVGLGVLFHTWMARHSKSYREYNECCYQLHGCSAHVFKEQILRDCIYE